MSDYQIDRIVAAARAHRRPANESAPSERAERCEWKANGEGIYQTTCGHLFQFTDDGPIENEQKFCGYCGKRLKAKPVGSGR